MLILGLALTFEQKKQGSVPIVRQNPRYSRCNLVYPLAGSKAPRAAEKGRSLGR